MKLNLRVEILTTLQPLEGVFMWRNIWMSCVLILSVWKQKWDYFKVLALWLVTSCSAVYVRMQLFTETSSVNIFLKVLNVCFFWPPQPSPLTDNMLQLFFWALPALKVIIFISLSLTVCFCKSINLNCEKEKTHKKNTLAATKFVASILNFFQLSSFSSSTSNFALRGTVISHSNFLCGMFFRGWNCQRLHDTKWSQY